MLCEMDVLGGGCLSVVEDCRGFMMDGSSCLVMGWYATAAVT